MLRAPIDYLGSNRTLLFECLHEIRERLANKAVPGLCTFNKTGMQKSVHTSGSHLKQISLKQGFGEIISHPSTRVSPQKKNKKQKNKRCVYRKLYTFLHSTQKIPVGVANIHHGIFNFFPPLEIKRLNSVSW